MDTIQPHGSPGTMIDVGVHFGSCTMPMLERGWRVIGFEPDRKKHAALREMAHENPAFTLYTCAVGDASHQGMQFYTSQESTGIASLVPFRESHEKGAVVPVRTLTEIVTEQSLTRVDYLKIDAEGYDLRVLEGFPFDRVLPEAILCEFEDAKTHKIGYSTHDLGRELIERGYEVYMSEWHPIVRYGITHRWRSLTRYPEQLADPEGWGNFLAFKPGPAASAAEAVLAPWLAR
ncbi:MAG: FkbM family methyltransferase [Planctomycetota bacterium]